MLPKLIDINSIKINCCNNTQKENTDMPDGADDDDDSDSTSACCFKMWIRKSKQMVETSCDENIHALPFQNTQSK